jgi:hypothetical protein
MISTPIRKHAAQRLAKRRRPDTEAKLTDNTSRGAICRRRHRIQAGEHTPRLIQNGLRGGGEMYTVTGALEQRETKVVFQGADAAR